jgi:hypothetical protein
VNFVESTNCDKDVVCVVWSEALITVHHLLSCTMQLQPLSHHFLPYYFSQSTHRSGLKMLPIGNQVKFMGYLLSDTFVSCCKEVCIDFLAHFPYFENVGVWDHHAVLCIPLPINFWMLESLYMKLGMYVMAPEPISTAYFIIPLPPLSVCSYVFLILLLGNNSVKTLPWQQIHMQQ